MARSAAAKASMHVSFHSDVRFDPGQRPRRRPSPTMATEIFQEFQAEQVTDAMLANAANLFGEHYGIWGTPPEGHSGAFGKPGHRVRMSASRLREQCLPAGAQCLYVSVIVDGVLAGNAFGCRWTYNHKQVCWVAQLVVHSDYRERRLATRLLEKLRKDEDEIFGIMSSHPAACMALSKACTNVALPSISLDFARDHAAGVLAGSPISYVRDAKLRGSLFPQDVAAEEDHISLVDSGFFVDHEEPLSALGWLRDKDLWSLGGLPDGHEFILVFQGARRHRSRSSSSGRSRHSRG
ncbi:hypothetical protein F4802DRAFT_290549 [Xylaria palmicola]|nr:hypothetical protein F4802DRAFT_290549 [Xylaria palmicola]